MAGLQSVLGCFRHNTGTAPEAAPIAMPEASWPTGAVPPTPVPQQIAAESARSADYFSWAAKQLPPAEREAISITYAGQAPPILKHNPATAAPNDPTLPEAIKALPTHAPDLIDAMSAIIIYSGLAACSGVLYTSIDPNLLTACAAVVFLNGMAAPIIEIYIHKAAWLHAQLVRSAFNHVQSIDPRRRLIAEPAVLSAWAQKQANQCETPEKKAQWELIVVESRDLAKERESWIDALKIQSQNDISQKWQTFQAWDQSIDERSLALYQRAEALLVLDEDSQSANANEG